MEKQWKQWEAILGGSKSTADHDCSHEIKRHLLLGRKAMTDLDRILKSRDITLPTKVCIVKVMVFPVDMYGCESWTVRRLSTKELMLSSCGAGKTLESHLDSKEIKPVNPKGNQSWIFFERTDTEAEAVILCHLTWRADSLKRPWCWKRLRAGEGDYRGQDGWMASLTQWTLVWASSGRWWRTGKPGVLQSMGLQRVGQDLVTKQQQSQEWVWDSDTMVIWYFSSAKILGILTAAMQNCIIFSLIASCQFPWYFAFL